MTSFTDELNHSASFTYNDNSWVTGIDYPTGTTTDYLYNANGWMTDIDVKKSDNTVILDLVYTYDFNGNITSEPIGANTWEYTYDALNRLVAVNKPGTADDIVYTYDPRGNRTDIDVGTTDNTDLTFNVADQLTRVDYEDGDYHTFTYDNNGNCTNMSHYPDIFLNSPSPSGGRCHEVTDEGALNPSPPRRGTQGEVVSTSSQPPENSPKYISTNSNIQNSTYNNGTTCATSAQNTPISSNIPNNENSPSPTEEGTTTLLSRDLDGRGQGEGALNPSPPRRGTQGEVVLDSSSSPSGGGTQGEGAFNSSYTPYELGKQYSTTSHEAKRTHYPHLLAPPSLRTANLPNTRPQRYLNPALWDAITLGNKTAESQLQAYMWQTESTCNPTRTFTPDAVTTYDYDYDNRLTTVNLPTNSDTVEYTYDATGRRLTKTVTTHTTEPLSSFNSTFSPPFSKGGRGVPNPQPAENSTLSPSVTNTDVTTYKYHYIGSQITEIEIDAIRNPGATQTVLRNEEVKIHLGANSQPISYEWVKHVGENTTQATYYYHYDIHGNVLKITDSSENTKITYTYDTLGTILTESNPDSILNFFTFRGASQTIWEPETGMYYSGGYYRPDTGTALQGTGAPVLTNPTTSSMIEAMAEATTPNAQLMLHSAISATTAGSAGGGTPGGFSPPSGPADGVSHAGAQEMSPSNSIIDSSDADSSFFRCESLGHAPMSGMTFSLIPKMDIYPPPGARLIGKDLMTPEGGGGGFSFGSGYKTIQLGLDPKSENTGGDGEIRDCQWPPKEMRDLINNTGSTDDGTNFGNIIPGLPDDIAEKVINEWLKQHPDYRNGCVKGFSGDKYLEIKNKQANGEELTTEEEWLLGEWGFLINEHVIPDLKNGGFVIWGNGKLLGVQFGSDKPLFWNSDGTAVSGGNPIDWGGVDPQAKNWSGKNIVIQNCTSSSGNTTMYQKIYIGANGKVSTCTIEHYNLSTTKDYMKKGDLLRVNSDGSYTKWGNDGSIASGTWGATSKYFRFYYNSTCYDGDPKILEPAVRGKPGFRKYYVISEMPWD